MKRKATRKTTKRSSKAKPRDLSLSKRAAAAAKGGALTAIVKAKKILEGANCWIAGPTDSTLRG